jgi:hypothetical protein
MIQVVAFVAGVIATAVVNSTKATDPDDDLDAITDMLIAETSFTRDKNEMAQIVFVAKNRSKRWGISMKDVVDPSGAVTKALKRASWNRGSPYRSRFEGARSNPRWGDARVFVRRALDGHYKNLGFMSFVHMKTLSSTTPCRAGTVAVSTEFGMRCVPEKIALNPTKVGGAVFA